MAANATPVVKPLPARSFGRFELRQLLGKSSATMSWLAFDPRSGGEVVLGMPRVQPADGQGLERWLHEARMAARLSHPNLAHVSEVGVQDHWPYVVVDRALGWCLDEWLQAHPQPTPAEAAHWICQVLDGLAFAHEAGVAHQDLQLHHLHIDEHGQVRVSGLDIVVEATLADTAFGSLQTLVGAAEPSAPLGTVLDPGYLRQRRDAAERDVLSVGLLLHHLLAGQPPLDDADTGRVIARLPPFGRETIRLPWAAPHPIPDALRAIANRATDRQPRRRYLNARTMWRALDGWRRAAEHDHGGPLALLLDRLHSVGHLPALPGVGLLVSRLSALEAKHTVEMAAPILRDMALSFELLRQVNTAQVQGTQITGSGPVLTIRRALALVGVQGVRQAAAALRAWPGPLDESDSAALKSLMDRVRLAGHLAQALRPAGYDAEVVYVIVLLQNLGRLTVQYHFPHEAVQIAALMQATPAAETDDARELPGMSEQAASYAVIGVDTEAIGAAVVRHLGLGDDVLFMSRRLATNRPVRAADGDAHLLRMAASAANEVVDALAQMPSGKAEPVLSMVAQRYARGLGLTQRELARALEEARAACTAGNLGMPAAGAGHAGQPPEDTVRLPTFTDLE